MLVETINAGESFRECIEYVHEARESAGVNEHEDKSGYKHGCVLKRAKGM